MKYWTFCARGPPALAYKHLMNPLRRVKPGSLLFHF